MIKELMHDPIFLAGKSEVATKEDLQVAQDLLDTLMAHRESCVGMAANMIGVRKRIIAVSLGAADLAMINPEIIRKEQPFETEEWCLSLSVVRNTTLYLLITVTYQDKMFRPHKQTFTGWTAQIIQHEIDDCNGILM